MAAPERRCVGCGRTAAKRDLTRLAVRDRCVVADPHSRLPGRGAYVCNAACAREALRRRAFGRAFRHAVTADPDLVESLH